ncbi:MAG: sugar isomerase domain-containing protein [Anaerolineales bacterium]
MKNDYARDYLSEVKAVLDRITETQLEPINDAAEICADTIASDGLVHLFATGHSRIMVEEMFPRHGSFPGFHPIVELSLTYHTEVVGTNGQRQAMFLEHVEGFGEVILRNFVLEPPDCFIIISNSGVNEVVIDVAMGAKARGLPLIALTSIEHSKVSSPKHSSGKRLFELADVVIDNGTPAGDALVEVEGLEYPVGPGSTVGGAAAINALKTSIAARLTQRAQPPCVLTSSYFIGQEASDRLFENTYDEYRRRMLRAYGGESTQDKDGC